MNSRHFLAVSILGITAFVFRTDIIPLVGLLFLFNVDSHFRWRYPLFKTVLVGALSTALGVVLTSIVDSILWGYPLWPEGDVLYFNTVLNRSSEWGTSPFPWYFTSALPRALTVALPFALLGMGRSWRKTISLWAPAFLFVLAYSLLPHKELRFIIHVVPVFNVLAALGAVEFLALFADIPLFARKNSPFRHIPGLLLAAAFLVSLLVTGLFVAVSRQNYSGGVAFEALHHQFLCGAQQRPVAVFIDNYAAQNGVSRFGECAAPDCRIAYDKDESRHGNFSMYDYVLTENRTVDGGGFVAVATVDGFRGLSVRDALQGRNPIQTGPSVFIFKNEKLSN